MVIGCTQRGWLCIGGIVLFTAASLSFASSSSDPNSERVQLIKHSFEGPLTYEGNLADWDLSGASIPAMDRIVLVPQVANKTGHLWHKDPITTNKFEIEFHFTVKGSDYTKSPGFAFWYVKDEFSRTYPMRSANPNDFANFKLFSYKGAFRGLGVFFSTFDHHGAVAPSVSAAWNDGSRTFAYSKDIPTADSMPIDFRNQNPTRPVRFKVTAGPTGVTGSISLSEGHSWNQCFSLAEAKVEAGGYFGFSADTGPAEGAVKKEGDTVVLLSVKAFNLNPYVAGEDATIVHKPDPATAVNASGDILRDHSTHKIEHEHAEALRGLTRLVYKHVSEAGPREQVISKTIASLATQMARLTADMNTLTKEVRSITKTNHSDAVHHLKSELMGLKSLFHKDAQTSASTLNSLHENMEQFRIDEVVHKDAAEVRKLTQKAAQLEMAVKKHSSVATYLIFFVAVMVALVAAFVWKKQKDLEKRHYL